MEKQQKKFSSSMMIPLGFFVKSHGTQGKLLLQLEDPIWMNIDPPLVKEHLLFLKKPSGFVPYRIIDVLPLGSNRYCMAFYGVKTLIDAKELRGITCYLPDTFLKSLIHSPILLDYEAMSALPKKIFLGYEVFREKQSIGILERIDFSTLQTKIFFRYQGELIPLPWAPPFILTANRKKRQMSIYFPPKYLSEL